MRHVLPPLPSLTAFEAAARHGSFTRAAEELNMSQSAVSKRIAGLEDWMDIKLFERVRQRIVLTEAGEHFLARVRTALEIMDEATVETLSLRPHATTFNLATLPSFGHYWLAPRLARFADSHPRISLNVTARKWPFDFRQENTDAAILYSPAPWQGGPSVRLFGEEMITVCAPGQVVPGDLSALGRLPLLHHRARHHDWQNWLNEGGIEDVNAFRGSRFEQFDMIIRCVANGHGIGLVPTFMATEDLEAGKIVQPFRRGMTSPASYYLAYPEGKAHHPALLAFKNWLFGEVIPRPDERTTDSGHSIRE
ncbi:LysR substrate-binding domain-containing protein [Chachezhania sediminis]|uniref:LysR substrate-binding domain-containing protein n=1 Tax=Chachezhania sediminis TaxID=2599291 RepID=UPI00131C9564|nr:LysR substrate-binding domain-containing protein [Chachezhania sediminis]